MPTLMQGTGELSELTEGRTLSLLRIGAAIGMLFSLADVAAMLGEPATALMPAVEVAIKRGLLTWTGGRLRFTSDEVWRSALSTVPPSVLLALRHEPEVPVQRGGEAVLDAVRALRDSGRIGQAVALAREARNLPDDVAAELKCVLAGMLLGDARPVEAATEAEPLLSDPKWGGVATGTWLLSLYMSDAKETREHVMRILTARDRTQDGQEAVAAATVNACLEWNSGHLAEALLWARDAARHRLDESSGWWWHGHAAASLALKLASLGEFTEAHDVLGDSASAVRLVVRARLLAAEGKIDEAETAAREGLALAQEELRLLVPLALVVLAGIALHKGDVTEAETLVRRYRTALSSSLSKTHSAQYDWVELQLVHAQHGAHKAAEFARGLDNAVIKAIQVEEPSAAAWLIRTALEAEDAELASRAVTVAEDLQADNPGFATLAAAAAHARALLDGDPEHLLDAAGRHRHGYAKAWANLDLGKLLGELGEQRQSQHHLRIAARMFDRIGAKTMVPVPTVPVRTTTIAPVSQLRQEPRRTGWQQLSDAERQIAALVAGGLTNRQVARRLFLSPHTVNYHLRGVFRKLGINSRVELARFAVSA